MDIIILIMLFHLLIACLAYPLTLSYLRTERRRASADRFTPEAMATMASLFPVLNFVLLVILLDIRRLERKRERRIRKIRRDIYLNMANRVENLKSRTPEVMHKYIDEAVASLKQEAENFLKKQKES